jgi:RNA polymerase sigma-70 factor (ECF subfamily)
LRLKAKSRSIDLVRSDVARVRREKDDAPPATQAPPSDSGLVAAEMAAHLDQALALLPPDESEPIRLAYFKGLTYREVALHLQLPEGTVKSRIRVGLAKLRLDKSIAPPD